jgi:oligopeptide transport system substrate-binding protein
MRTDRPGRGPALALALAPVIALALAGAARAEGPVELRMPHGTTFDSFDPQVSFTADAFDFFDQVFVGLTRVDSRTGALTLDLATGYTVSPDGRTYRFRLRAARWSDGQPLTADDVVFGIERTLDPNLGGPGSFEIGPPTASVLAVKALDPQTVEIDLDGPFAPLLAVLSMPTYRPVPRHVIEAWGDAWTDPAHIVTSGAYRVESVAEGTSIVLAKNPFYYGAAGVEIERVVYEDPGAEDEATLLAQFKSGQLDYVGRLNGPFGSAIFELADARADPALAADLHVGPAPTTFYLALDTVSGPTTDVNVRRALAAALDRRALAAIGVGDPSLEAKTLTAPPVFGPLGGEPWFPEPYDLAAARAFQAKAGANFPATIKLTEFGRRPQVIYQTIKAQWEAAFNPPPPAAPTFTVDLDPEPAGVLFGSLGTPGQSPATTEDWLEDYQDPHDFLYLLLDPNAGFAGTGWTNPLYDWLVEDAATEQSPLVRRAEYIAAEGIVRAEAPVIPIYYDADAFLARPGLQVVGTRIEGWRLGQ